MSILRKDSSQASNAETGDAESGVNGAGTTELRQVERTQVVSRRGVLWRAGVATAAGVGALTVLDQHRAEAATGGNFVLGNINDAGNTTTLKRTNSTFPNPLMSLDGTGLSSTATTLIATGPAGGAAVNAQGFTFANTLSTTSGPIIGLAIAGSGSGSANGVLGQSGSGYGVQGSSGSGIGVFGNSTSGTGVDASSSSGLALKVTGKTQFSRSGLGQVASGNSSKVVSVTDMTTDSLVLVTLQKFVAGVYIVAAVPKAGKFTVYLNQNAPSSMKFSWFVIAG